MRYSHPTRRFSLVCFHSHVSSILFVNFSNTKSTFDSSTRKGESRGIAFPILFSRMKRNVLYRDCIWTVLLLTEEQTNIFNHIKIKIQYDRMTLLLNRIYTTTTLKFISNITRTRAKEKGNG